MSVVARLLSQASDKHYRGTHTPQTPRASFRQSPAVVDVDRVSDRLRPSIVPLALGASCHNQVQPN